MKTKIIVILIPIIVAVYTVVTILNNRPDAETLADLKADAENRRLAQPVLTLKKVDRTIEVLVRDEKQFFTVTDKAGKTLAERVTMEELTAMLPETAEQVGSGLADISAVNDTRIPVPAEHRLSPPAARLGTDPDGEVKFSKRDSGPRDSSRKDQAPAPSRSKEIEPLQNPSVSLPRRERMKRKLRFQTKLMLAMSFIIVVVLGAFLLVTESRVRKTYVRHFSEDFRKQVDQLRLSRDERTRGYLELCAKLADTDLPSQLLQGKKPKKDTVTAFWEEYRDSFQEIAIKEMPDRPEFRQDKEKGKGKGPQMGGFGGMGMLQHLGPVGVIDPEGNIIPIIDAGSESGSGRRFAARKMSISEDDMADYLVGFPASDLQQIGYFATENREGQAMVQEIIATPVKDSENGELLGLFLRGNPSETISEKFLDRYNEEFGNGEGLLSGIYLTGKFYGKNADPDFMESVGNAISEDLGPNEPLTGSIEAGIAGNQYQIQFEALNRSSSMPTAYQAIVFPLSQLHSDLNALRIRGTGIGLAAILLGLAMAAFLSRNFSTPIQELAAGTQHIREGNFAERVRVRSNDEIGELADSFNSMAEELGQKAKYRELLGKVSDEAVAQAMISGSLDLELGGELKEVSVLFCDIRGFTDLTEKMNPSDVIDLLNDHMTAMTRIVREHYGVVDKFVGDEIMAVFGALKKYGNDAENAARCALEMIAERDRLNADLEIPFTVGVGIATGEVVAGCMGSIDRLNYTVLGARVNLASRLCGAAAPMEAIIDDKTQAAISEEISAEEIDELALRGFSSAVTAWRIGQRDGQKAKPERLVKASG